MVALLRKLALGNLLKELGEKDKSNLGKCLEFYHQQQRVTNLLQSAEREYYNDLLHSNQCIFKEIFSICDSLLGQKKDLPLTPNHTNQDLDDWFNKYFINKITNIRLGINVSHQGEPQPDRPEVLLTQPVAQCSAAPVPSFFIPLTVEQITKCIMECPSKIVRVVPYPQCS